MNISTFLFSILCIFASASVQASTDTFPGRSEFPDVRIFSMKDLSMQLNKVLIIDTRSSYEYETIHINTAINIPVSSKTFVEQVKKVRYNTNKPIVFYCNGRTCYKSYKATAAAMKNNIKNVYAYDAGMFEWANAHPDKTTLLTKSPIDTTDLLNKKKLTSHMLTPDVFSKRVYTENDNLRVLDIRDLTQRANGVGYFSGIEYWIDLNQKQKVIDFMRKADADKKTLMIYDAVGKQVRWLQYTLEKENIKNYYFMKKGAKGFYDQIINVKR